MRAIDKKTIKFVKKMKLRKFINLIQSKFKDYTPQGGILSPLLANVVFNELDWWLSNQ
ncbi:MAG: hypothetical protein IJ509_00720 [Bacilli bacterium]|nr:hypothetical protein [Bacilli bacterium]